jgi:predicted nucleic acid-binding protein
MTRLPPVFLDTGGWIELVQRGGTASWVQALSRSEAGFGKAHTSDYVILETYSFLMKNHRRPVALGFLEVATGPEFIIHPSDADLVDRAMATAQARSLKRELNLVDWTTALLMQDHHIRHLLTTDRGFAQLGFELITS